MQYETIILELLSRNKKLEEEVTMLKEIVGSCDRVNDQESEVDDPIIVENRRAQNSYTKMTDEMIEICYKCGKKLNDGSNSADMADMIVDKTGMNRNSAIMYLYAVSSLLSGTVFKRAISCKALRKYYDMIFNEYGSAGLKKAIQATRLHINYREECGLTADAIEELCDEYQCKL